MMRLTATRALRAGQPGRAGRQAHGFSLVELLVGIVVAMAAVIVIMQMFKVSEGMRRSTSGGDDAQTTGAIALSLLQRDLRQAGQGLMNPQLLGCQLSLPGGKTVAMLAPLLINPAGIPAGDTSTDVLLIAYGEGGGSPEGSLIGSQPTATSYAVTAPDSFQPNDRIIITPPIPTLPLRPLPCALTLTGLTAAPASGIVPVQTAVANASNGVIFNLGLSPRFIAYAVRNARLTSCDFMTQDCTRADAADWTEVADNIVSLRALYAKDTATPRSGQAGAYDQTTPTMDQALSWCALSRIVGVTLTLVARNRQPESAEVAASAPVWSRQGSAPITLQGSDAARYRYKTFETTVPLRNIPGAAEPAFTSC